MGQGRLREMAFRDKKTKEDQQALNSLESFVYDSELSMEEEDFIANSSTEERQVRMGAVSEASGWKINW